MTRFATLAFAATATVLPAVQAHGFISQWGISGGQLEKAQKTDLGSTSMRQGSDNTGWVGSNFLETASIACSASNTPFNTVAAPDGTIFSSPDQGAGKSLAVQPGQKIQFVVSGEAGKGFPHPEGHVQTYMADCGGDCKNFDVTKGKFFKIQSEKDGIQNTLRPAYDGSVDGNRYDVTIPKAVPAGNYIVRYELIAFGQSSSVEGNQDQYYPYCGQITLGGSGNAKRDLETRELFERQANGKTVSFPGAYSNGNIDAGSLPGPALLTDPSGVVGGGSSGGSGSGSGNGGPKGGNGGNGGNGGPKGPKGGVNGGNGGAGTGSGTVSTGGSASLDVSSAGACASKCLEIKISERTTLGAESCSATDGSCMCSSTNFMAAFAQCMQDNCSDEKDAAVEALSTSCASSGSVSGSVNVATSGSSSSGSCKSKAKRAHSPSKSKRSGHSDSHLSSGKSKRLHRIRRGGNHPVTAALRATSHH